MLIGIGVFCGRLGESWVQGAFDRVIEECRRDNQMVVSAVCGGRVFCPLPPSSSVARPV